MLQNGVLQIVPCTAEEGAIEWERSTKERTNSAKLGTTSTMTGIELGGQNVRLWRSKPFAKSSRTPEAPRPEVEGRKKRGWVKEFVASRFPRVHAFVRAGASSTGPKPKSGSLGMLHSLLRTLLELWAALVCPSRETGLVGTGNRPLHSRGLNNGMVTSEIRCGVSFPSLWTLEE